jgi:hypothetical protein
MEQFQEVLLSLSDCGEELSELRSKIEQLIYLYQKYLAPDQYIYSSRRSLNKLKKKYRIFPLISYELHLNDCHKYKFLRSECSSVEYERFSQDFKYILFRPTDFEFFARKVLTGREIEEKFCLVWVPSRPSK